MFLRRRSGAPISRGQAMVEFALVLPILALLLVMALDFGRVFFGWVALQNAARIGADRASQTAAAWPTADGGKEISWRADYQTFISSDLRAANCDYPTPHPDPTFTDTDVPPNGDHDFGDLATVHLECTFDLITPLAEGILGGSVTLAAESSFAINGMIVVGVPDPPPPPPEDCAVPVASFDTVPVAAGAGGTRLESPSSPFTVSFYSATPSPQACPITGYRWEIDGIEVIAIPDPDKLTTQQFTDAPGGGHTDYEVTLTVSSAEGSDEESITVRVRA